MCQVRVSLTLLVLLSVAAGGSLVLPAPAPAQEPAAGGLPVEKVVLFTSGVGFFDRRGEVQGDAEVQLRFNVEDVNDLLKSMVVQDFGGGRVSAVTYGSRDPITRTLKTFAIDLTGQPTLAELLRQIRGERIEVEAPAKLVGTLVGVERHEEKLEGNRTIAFDMIVLLTEQGLTSMRLDRLGRLRLLNEALDREFRQALAILALENTTEKKTVTCRFLGEGSRPVRIAYIQEAPVWKTSYRLVLADDKAPFLQGWAIVENTTEEDWDGVELTLVSGRPISFIMDLYKPLYLQRPVVELELYASLKPPVAERTMEKMEREGAAVRRRAARDKDAASAAIAQAGGPYGTVPPGAPTPTPTPTPTPMDLALGVAAAAQGAEVGELFQYVIGAPVSLARQRSAMLPIVNTEVKGDKVSIYNAAVHALHPLNGFRLENATGLSLMQGPITVFDGGAYAGDARIQDLKPGEKRLLSYALDLGAEVRMERPGGDELITAAKVVKGVMIVERKYQRTTKYTIKNAAERQKTVLVEHPRDAHWKRVAPKHVAEETQHFWRLEVAVGADATEILLVVEERMDRQQMALTTLDSRTIGFYQARREIGPELQAVLAEVLKRKMEVASLAAAQNRHQTKIQAISQDQDRMRRMMEHIDRETDLYRRYLKKVGEQEDEIEAARAALEKLEAERARKQKELEDYLAGLSVE
ncbi:MAG: hypothetical protein JXQ29_14010 [Planctomycetes bacterium]|nr:hypothetical protein [Planctomycetota bacterium]